MNRNTKKEYAWSKRKYTRILGDIDKELGDELKEKLKTNALAAYLYCKNDYTLS